VIVCVRVRGVASSPSIVRVLTQGTLRKRTVYVTPPRSVVSICATVSVCVRVLGICIRVCSVCVCVCVFVYV